MSNAVTIPLPPPPALPSSTRDALLKLLQRDNNKAIFDFRTVLCEQIVATKYDIKLQERLLQLLRETDGSITKEEAIARVLTEATEAKQDLTVPEELTAYGGYIVRESLRNAVVFKQGKTTG